jgi:phage terminase small subunit
MPKYNGLSPKEKMFVVEYLKDLNASQAFLRAGYKSKRLDIGSAKVMGKIGVREAIREAQEKRSERTMITIDKVLTDIELIKADAMKQTDGKMADRAAALKACELLGKHLKMFTDKVEHTGANGKPLFEKIIIELVHS